MILFSNSKINIGLQVLSKRDDGFHNIRSIFYPIPLSDVIEITTSDSFKFTNSGIQIDPNSNLILDAFNLIKEHYDIGNVSINIHKQIPLGAGLGGGSSNATNTLIGLSQLFDIELNNTELIKLAEQLGSDCPFFLKNRPQLVTGRGEELEDTDFNLSTYFVKIVNIGIHISTKEAFADLNPKAATWPSNWLELENDFESTVFMRYPELAAIKDRMLADGAIFASMTGTGSTIYGLYRAEPGIFGDYSFEKNMELR